MLDLDAKTRQDAVRDFLKNMQFTAREFTAREWHVDCGQTSTGSQIATWRRSLT